MGRPCLWTPIKSDAATITGTAALGDDFEIGNLLSIQPTKTYRTDPVCTINLDLGSAKTIRGLFLGYAIGVSVDSVFRLRATNTLASITSAPSLDTGDVRHWPGTRDYSGWSRTHGFALFDAPVSYRYWQIDVDNDGTDYELGRIYLDSPWFFPLGLDFGSRIAYREQVRRVRSIGGQLYTASNGIWREAAFSLRSKIGADEFIEGAETIERLRGTSRDVLLMLDTEDANLFMDRSIYCTFADLQPTETVMRGLWSKSFLLEEMELP